MLNLDRQLRSRGCRTDHNVWLIPLSDLSFSMHMEASTFPFCQSLGQPFLDMLLLTSKNKGAPARSISTVKMGEILQHAKCQIEQLQTVFGR
ncbi:hypothetical protein D9M69_530090 [compost metagenome]